MTAKIRERHEENFEVLDDAIVYHTYKGDLSCDVVIIPKEIFLEAFRKWIIPLSATETNCKARGKL